MKERFVEIPTAAGRMETFVSHPEQDGPFPLVVLYMDVWGVREELYDLARRVATVGYYCMVPDWYYRQGRVRSTTVDDQGQADLARPAEQGGPGQGAGAGAQARRRDGGRGQRRDPSVPGKAAASRPSPGRSARSATAWAAVTSCRNRKPPIPIVSGHRPACTAPRSSRSGRVARISGSRSCAASFIADLPSTTTTHRCR